MFHQQLADKLHKPIIRNFEKQNVHSLFIDNIWSADLEGMQLINKFDKVFYFEDCLLLCF